MSGTHDNPSAPHTPVLLRPCWRRWATVSGSVGLDWHLWRGGLYPRAAGCRCCEVVGGWTRDPLAFRDGAGLGRLTMIDKIVRQRGRVFQDGTDYCAGIWRHRLDLERVLSGSWIWQSAGFRHARRPFDIAHEPGGPSAADIVKWAREDDRF